VGAGGTELVTPEAPEVDGDGVAPLSAAPRGGLAAGGADDPTPDDPTPDDAAPGAPLANGAAPFDGGAPGVLTAP
jgi:hypothetical protein